MEDREWENQEQSLTNQISEVPKRSPQKKKKSTLRETIEVVVIAVILAFLLRTFIVENFWVPSRSMVPTIKINDHVLVTKFSYWFSEPQRGDVVVFEPPEEAKNNDNEKYYIKRLIGLPGETIVFEDNKLYINGTFVEESYLSDDVVTDDFGPYEVPENCYFFCGDNRTGSYDSRYWGCVEKDALVGKGQCIYWPIARMGGL